MSAPLRLQHPRGARVAARAAVALAVASPGSALARESARLELTRGPGADACPDHDALVARVAEHLGYDPFRADAPRTVTVAFAREGEGLRASITKTDARGAPVGRRELVSDRPDCADLADGAVLTVSILVDPPLLAAASRVATPGGAEPAHEHAATPASAHETSALAARFGGGVVVGTGSAPAINGGLFVFGGVARGAFSIDVEGRADLPASGAFDLGSARTSIRVAELVPCAHLGVGFGCLFAGAGAISADGLDVRNPKHLTAFYALAGARVGVELRIAGPLFARVAFDATTPLTRTTIAVGDADLWSTPALAGGIGAGVLGRFP